MPEIVSMGEMLVEIMRTEVGVPLGRPAGFKGPFPSGAPANYVDAAARLGGDTGFMGAVGPDEFGDLVVQRLHESGVDVSQVKRREGMTTGCAFVSYGEDGSRKFIFHMRHAAAGSLGPDDVDPGYLRGTKLLHIAGSSLAASDSCRDACYKAVHCVKENGGRVSFDPNVRLELLGIEKVRRICAPVLEASDIILPSGKEACMLVGNKSVEEACESLLERAELVVLKLGAEGCRVFSQEEEGFEEPPFEIEKLMPPVDPTGAGDCFAAGFAVCLVAGEPLKECARLGNAAGAICITQLGPMEGTVSRETLKAIEARLSRS
jgi:sugar/nucleoside kinase (ribokinase family)